MGGAGVSRELHSGFTTMGTRNVNRGPGGRNGSTGPRRKRVEPRGKGKNIGAARTNHIWGTHTAENAAVGDTGWRVSEVPRLEGKIWSTGKEKGKGKEKGEKKEKGRGIKTEKKTFGDKAPPQQLANWIEEE